MSLDYQRIAAAIEYIQRHAGEQPKLEQLAGHMGLSPFHAQKLFSRWAGVSPKRFLQCLTLDSAKSLLRERMCDLLHVSDELGLSSSSRLYDHFVQLEAVTPGDFKRFGAGLCIDYGVHQSMFGWVFLAVTTRGICQLDFLDEPNSAEPLMRLQANWPEARMQNNYEATAVWANKVFNCVAPGGLDRAQPISLLVKGTNFQIQVWQALLRIPVGKLTSYQTIAHAIAKPKANRAVGSAVGANPIGWLIPCHRVIRQSGALGGYKWGLTRKHAILLAEHIASDEAF